MSDIAQLEMRLCKSNDKISQLKGDVNSLKETVKKLELQFNNLELQFNNYVIENQRIAENTPIAEHHGIGIANAVGNQYQIDPNKKYIGEL